MKNLIVNGTVFGEVVSYHQDRSIKAWVFFMKSKATVMIQFTEIKLFTSAENLEIITK